MKRRDALHRPGRVVLLLGANEIAFGARIVAGRVRPSVDDTPSISALRNSRSTVPCPCEPG